MYCIKHYAFFPLHDSDGEWYQIHTPLHEFHHDATKLKRKSMLASNRSYKLKTGNTLPKSVDLRTNKHMPHALDQGQLGSCASNSMANILYFRMGCENKTPFHPSRLALYYNCRVKVEGEAANEDTGATCASLWS